MNNQEIIDNATNGNFKSVLIQANATTWMPTDYRSLADIKRIAELEKGYEELRIAALNAVCKIGGGQAKADLRDAYDKATETLEALKEPKP